MRRGCVGYVEKETRKENGLGYVDYLKVGSIRRESEKAELNGARAEGHIGGDEDMEDVDDSFGGVPMNSDKENKDE